MMGMKSHLRRFADESGQTIVFAALIMVVLIGMVGLAIDVGHMRHVKQQLQRDADAAALAAAREIRLCGVTNGSSQVVASCPYMTTAATSALAENESSYSTTSTVSTGCAPATSTSITLSLNDPPACTGSPVPPANTAYIEAVVTKEEPTYFARIFGITNIALGAHAVASRNAHPPCIYALNPHDAGSLTYLANALFAITCGVVVESDSPDAVSGLLCLGNSAPSFVVNGSDQALLALACVHPHQASPPVPADPLAYLPAPPQANDPCPSPANTPITTGGFLGLLATTTFNGANTKDSPEVPPLLTILHNYVFNPGVYCGGITIDLALAANITFNPGVYVLRGDGNLGGFNMDLTLLSPITVGTGGTQPIGGVMFYNESSSTPSTNPLLYGFNLGIPSIGGDLANLFKGTGNIGLQPPTSGEYAGMLLFQPSSNVGTDNILANILFNTLGGSYGGTLYAPGATVNFTASVASTNNNSIVADKINFTAGALSTLGIDATATSLGSPLVGDDAVLVQ